MPFEVIGRGLLASAFASARTSIPQAIVCASGVSDSSCMDARAFRREQELLSNLAGVARNREWPLVYFSASSVYGPTSEIRVETRTPAPATPYGRHKLMCETVVRESGARYLVLRLPNVVGTAGHPHQLIPALVRQVLSGSVLVSRAATRDLLDVDDLVAVVHGLLRLGIDGCTLNVASGISTPAHVLVETISLSLGLSPKVIWTDDGERQEFSISAVRGLLPAYPEFAHDYPAGVLMRRVPQLARAITLGIPP